MTSERERPFAWYGARLSVFLPLMGIGSTIACGVLLPEADAIGTAVAGVGLGLACAGLVLGVHALRSMSLHGSNGIIGFAAAGTSVNGIIILSALAALPVFDGWRTPVEETPANPWAGTPLTIEGGEEVLAPDFSYRLEIPGSFTTNRQAQRNPLIEYAFVQHTNGEPPVEINIHRSPLTSDADAFRQDFEQTLAPQLPDGTQTREQSLQWQQTPVPALHHTIPYPNGQVSVFAVLLPLEDASLQINVSAPSNSTEDLVALLQAIIRSYQTRPNPAHSSAADTEQ